MTPQTLISLVTIAANLAMIACCADIIRRGRRRRDEQFRDTPNAMDSDLRARCVALLADSERRRVKSGPCEQNRHGQCNVSCGCICHG